MTGDMLQFVVAGSIIIYPLVAKSWLRAGSVAFLVTLAWGVLRMVTIIEFGGGGPPMIGFLLAPFFSAGYALLVYGAKILCLNIPIVRRWRSSLRRIETDKQGVK